MTTPRDLMTTAMDESPDRPVAQGELSLALAGAELIDLLAAEDVTLDGDLIVPGIRRLLDDALLDQAAASLAREEPFESVEDWLWRRGRDLAATYAAAFASEGRLTRERRRWVPVRTGQVVVADSEDHRNAQDRWAAGEPVLTALATAAGIRANDVESPPSSADDAVGAVLAAVDDAVTELEAVRQRRAIEQAAYDNIWRVP
jgi:hypothetical protein